MLVDVNVLSRCLRTVCVWLRLEGDNWKWLALIAGVALAVRVAWVLATVPMPNWDAADYDGLAWRLGKGMWHPMELPPLFDPSGIPLS